MGLLAKGGTLLSSEQAGVCPQGDLHNEGLLSIIEARQDRFLCARFWVPAECRALRGLSGACLSKDFSAQ